MNSAETTPGDGTPAPEHISLDQLVAMNMRHWRKAAGKTQEEFGRLLGWSAANVSAAERSADGGRDRRRFDAQTLGEIALALGVPLTALFLPPEDGARYVFTAGGTAYGMGDLVELLVMPDSDDDSPVVNAYRVRFQAAADRYLTPDWGTEVARWLRGAEPAQVRAERAASLRAAQAQLAAIAAAIEGTL